MKGKKRFVFMLMILVAGAVGAQVQADNEVISPEGQFQDHGGVVPWFWIGIQTVFSGGYNMETGAGGFRNYGGDNDTSASFNLAFVDSHYQTPKFYEVPRNIDPAAWTGKFKLMNFTSRINSWENGATGVENRNPSWLAEITGRGVHIGFFTQAGNLIGSLDDSQNTTDNKPVTRISAGNKVLQLQDTGLGINYYSKSAASNKTEYSSPSGAIMYTGYEKPDLFNVYLTMLSEGNVNSDVRDKKNDAFAAALDFGVTPFGLITDDEVPLTFNVAGNVIGGFNWESVTKQNIGFGLKAESGIWLRKDNFVLTPVFAFDGRLDSDNKFTPKMGGGLIFQFSGMRWVADDWNELTTLENQDFRYENNRLLKYSYGQVYLAYSEKDDLDMVLKVEEPDGNVGIHEKLGAMAEFRMFNLTKKVSNPNNPEWALQGRVSWDLDIKKLSLTPYIRSYLDSQAVLKLRLGAYANFIPYTGFELAYTSANLNRGADTTKRPLSHYESIFDAGRIELIVILKSDEVKPHPPKRMNEWNYPNTIPDR
ncbi:MAG: hypothetical protein LBN21_10110 [Treponema sp.]|jgi:hypothetical protein|nr:hypothetical protein [Treponema sp.]